MKNRLFLMAITTATLTLSDPQISLAKTVSYDFTVDVLSGPLTGERYTGMTSVDVTDLLKDNNESVKSTSITFEFGDAKFTEADDVQNPEADSPRANFQGGEFLGNTYIVSSFGNNATEIPFIQNVAVDGFAIDNGDFGYVVGANLYRGIVTYRLLPGDEQLDTPAQSVPEPSFWMGLVTIGYAISGGRWLTRLESDQ
ncbi:hypothetical protein [Leptothoe sp. PORK10 BA2]|uniref:hypothetical protein n=1 Tax=Leptothoe sp. PORK10 BA2 TaxID=3110254 RepID=UPI002B1EA447|nr:hypothetical protein [Leptothoe sp. PORK10 BA2]MEA5464379.1 hypothetical protein [Leptothoe sp. PORK10 BA2]